MELDSHADTIILGKECVEIYNWNHLVKVSGYNPKDRERLCKTISGEVVHDHPHTGKVCLLIFHQCIHANHPDHHLLCSIQCRMHGVEINETPKFLLKKPTDSSHAIVVEDPEGGGSMVIPLLINGLQVTSHVEIQHALNMKMGTLQEFISLRRLQNGIHHIKTILCTRSQRWTSVVTGSICILCKKDQIWSSNRYLLGQG